MDENIKNKTDEKPKKRPGKGGVSLPEARNHFSSTNQPSPQDKKDGWAKKKMQQNLARAFLELKPDYSSGNKLIALRKQCALLYNLPEEKITVEMMMYFAQGNKAITECDTQAFNAIMDRANGKPTQSINIKDESDPVIFVLPNGREIEI